MTRHADTLATAIRQHRAGQLAEAEAAYRRILADEPRHVDAWQLLGVLATETNRVALAIASLDEALAIAGPHARLQYHRAAALERTGRIEEAIESYRQALELRPHLAVAALRMSGLLRQRGDHIAAARVLARAARSQPRNAALAYELGSILHAFGQHARALVQYKRAVTIDPRQVRALIHAGDCWLALARADRAVEWYRRALVLRPTSVSARNNLGGALQALGRLDEAIAEYRQVVRQAPSSFEARVNLATALHELGESTTAIDELHAAIALQPGAAAAYTNLGAIHEDRGECAAAMDAYERAVALEPQNADAHLHRSLLLIQREQFAEGWDEYEWRFRTRSDQRARNFPCPVWDGSSLAQRSILVHGEQGIGDEIMFATCLPELVDGACSVTLTCDNRLAGLFARSFPRARVLGVERGKEDWGRLSADSDCHLPAGSLPRFFRRHADDFRSHRPLLMPDPARVAAWRSRLRSCGAGLLVGISWRGGAESKLLDGSGQGAGYRAQARRRSCGLSDWQPLLATAGVHFINLQHNMSDDDRRQIAPEFAARFHSFDDVDLWSDFDECAALIAALDLVISVGNATVHLAGAIGTPTWAVLPRFWGWRWLRDRSDCLWYARVRIWRQHESGDWSGLLARVAESLAVVRAQRLDSGAPLVPRNRSSASYETEQAT
jgi:tetratricopeptide (TPR) repeat protein